MEIHPHSAYNLYRYVILDIGGGRVLGLGLYIDGMVSSQLPGKEIRSVMLEMPAIRAAADKNQKKENMSC